MSTPAAKKEDYSYYFYPLSQSCCLEKRDELSLVINLTIPPKFPENKVTEVVKKLGNYITIVLLINKSRETGWNYCVDYTKHASTCEQEKKRFCKRYLEDEEIEECQKLKKYLEPLLLKELVYKMPDLDIPRGEVDLMRRIVDCVRKTIKKPLG